MPSLTHILMGGINKYLIERQSTTGCLNVRHSAMDLKADRWNGYSQHWFGHTLQHAH